MSLKDGWSGTGSKAVDRAAFYVVEYWLGLALAGIAAPRLPFVVPLADGGIQIEWHRQGLDFEISFWADGEITALLEDRDIGLEIENEGDEALDLLLRFAPGAAQDLRNADAVLVQAPASLVPIAA